MLPVYVFMANSLSLDNQFMCLGKAISSASSFTQSPLVLCIGLRPCVLISFQLGMFVGILVQHTDGYSFLCQETQSHSKSLTRLSESFFTLPGPQVWAYFVDISIGTGLPNSTLIDHGFFQSSPSVAKKNFLDKSQKLYLSVSIRTNVYRLLSGVMLVY